MNDPVNSAFNLEFLSLCRKMLRGVDWWKSKVFVWICKADNVLLSKIATANSHNRTIADKFSFAESFPFIGKPFFIVIDQLIAKCKIYAFQFLYYFLQRSRHKKIFFSSDNMHDPVNARKTLWWFRIVFHSFGHARSTLMPRGGGK